MVARGSRLCPLTTTLTKTLAKGFSLPGGGSISRWGNRDRGKPANVRRTRSAMVFGAGVKSRARPQKPHHSLDTILDFSFTV